MKKISIDECQGDFGNLEPTLTPLSCAACGSTVSLTDGKSGICPACASTVLFPESYQELRKLQQENRQKLKEAESSYAELADAPAGIIKIWYDSANVIAAFITLITAVLLFLGGWLALVVLFLTYFVTVSLAEYLGENYADTWGIDKVYLLVFLILSIGVVLPLVLYAYADDKIKLKKIIQASLAAKPNVNHQTQYDCRACGAPLEAPPESIAACCDYCGAENLVALPHDWLQKIAVFSKWNFKTIAETVQTAKRYTQEQTENLKIWIAATILIVPFSWCMGLLIEWTMTNDGYSAPSWKLVYEEDISKRRLFPDQTIQNNSPSVPAAVHVWAKLPELSYWVALRAKETLEWQLAPAELPVQYVAIRGTTSFEPAEVKDFIEQDSTNKVYTFKAPFTGLFLLTFPQKGLQIRWKVKLPA